MLGLAVFVRALEPLTSGAIFGVVEAGATANGRTILSAGLTLALLILPIIIISSQEAIRAVPGSLRQAGLAFGRYQVADNLGPRAAQRPARHSYRGDSFHVAGCWRDRAIGGDWRFHLHYCRSYRPFL